MTDGRELVDPQAYAEHGYPHDLWTELRNHDPLRKFEPAGWRPFWAVTKHADICEISRQPEIFLNGPRMTLVSNAAIAASGQPDDGTFNGMRTIINMDGADHRKLRKVASPYFTPRSLRTLQDAVEASARELVDELAARGPEGECDFVTDVANLHPLRIICQILGVPREDEPMILRMTNELFGHEDAEFQRAEDRQTRLVELGMEMYEYFGTIIADRRAKARGDLASVFANATIDGAPMSDMDTFGYYLITFTAGHETTRGGIAGGMKALIDHAEQRRTLAADPSLVPTATNEIVRWVTPVNHMVRTAAADYELRGRRIAAGDTLVLFYASANRDEEIFDDPFTFRIDRHDNPHLGFGIGEHFCLGANLARQTTGALFAELTPRLESVELAGTPQRVASNLVPGFKHMPIRYRIRPRA
jgi:cytochrome P450